MQKLLTAVLLVCGCGGGSSGSDLGVDLGHADMSVELDLSVGYSVACMRTPVDDPLTIDSKVVDLIGTPLPGITVTLYKADGTMLAQATGADGGAGTGANGSFQLSVATGGTLFFGYLKFTGPNIPDTYWYRDFWKSQSSTDMSGHFPVLTNPQVAVGYSAVSLTADSSKGTLAVVVTNCAPFAVPGATVAISPAPGRLAYSGGSASPAPAPNATYTSNDGVAFGFNQAVGQTTFSATLHDGHLYAARTVDVKAGTVTVFGPYMP
jgi:hypothetical protein